MKAEINGDEVRIYSENTKRKFSIKIYRREYGKDGDGFNMSLCFDGFEHGCLPMIEVTDNDIIITNNLEKGRQLYK